MLLEKYILKHWVCCTFKNVIINYLPKQTNIFSFSFISKNQTFKVIIMQNFSKSKHNFIFTKGCKNYRLIYLLFAQKCHKIIL